MSQFNFYGVNPALKRFAEYLAIHAAQDDIKVELFHHYLNEYLEQVGREQPGTYLSQQDAEYEEYLHATGQAETFRQWQMETREEREMAQQADDMTGTLASLNVLSSQSDQQVMDEIAEDHDIKMEDDHEEPAREFSQIPTNPGATDPGTNAEYAPSQPITALSPIPPQPNAGLSPIPLQPNTALSSVPPQRKSGYDYASRFHFMTLFTRGFVEQGDELHVPIYEYLGSRSDETAVMVYQSKTAATTNWRVYCSIANIHDYPMTGKGPKQFCEKISQLNLRGPNAREWSNTVEVYRGGQSMGTVTELKAMHLL